MAYFLWMVITTCLLFNGFVMAVGPDMATTQLIQQLGLKESPQAIREAGFWRKPKRIVVLLEERQHQSMPNAANWLQQVVGDAELVIAQTRTEMVFLLDDADVLLGYCTHETLENGTQLRYILNYSAGVDRCMKSGLVQERDFLLTNMQRIYGPGIAEHVIAMMYMLTRKLHIFHDKQRQHDWDRSAVKRTEMWELQGRTMLVVGLGGIGTEVARRAQALGMRVIATRNSSRKGPEFVDYVGLAHELPALAGQADVVVNATPLTPATLGLFDSKLFRQMKPGAYFINVGRGKSVVTKDLIEALNTGHLGGAALDVQDPEPLPREHPLWSTKNIIITPHISAGSSEQMDRFWLLVRENLRRYVNGERMLNVVDIKHGY
ncbi:MAG: D-2-hydroxyacid dehydrogenase [Candidatus Thiodiazotropha sp. (ex Lucinoma borealis)]|nr:D-2-hydroxyacid dehydrogenase [Candidatus Thiodiazotropha sp. (ex Lucinoma borealis)]